MPPSVKPVVDFVPKSPLPKPTEGADVVAVAVEEPRVPKLSPPVELLQNKTISSNFFFKIKNPRTPLFQFLSHSIIHFPKPHTTQLDKTISFYSSIIPTASLTPTPAFVQLLAELIHTARKVGNLNFSVRSSH